MRLVSVIRTLRPLCSSYVKCRDVAGLGIRFPGKESMTASFLPGVRFRASLYCVAFGVGMSVWQVRFPVFRGLAQVLIVSRLIGIGVGRWILMLLVLTGNI